MATATPQITHTPARSYPHLRTVPLLGTLDAYRMEQLGFYRHLVGACGDVARFDVFNIAFLVFNTPEFAHAILVEHAADFDKGEVVRRAFRPVIGNGLFINEGASHRRQRKLMAPSFQPRHIQSYAETMVRYAERAQERWSEGQVVDIGAQLSALTMSIVGKVLFDADVFGETDELGAAIQITFGYVNDMLIRPFLPPLAWPLPGHSRVRDAIALVRARLQAMIDERRAHPQPERDDFLSILLAARDDEHHEGGGMSDQQVMDEAVTLFGAGHETTATALLWTWYLLATHPETYDRLRQEVDDVLGGRPPTYADLERLPYTLQVLKEAMRLYPPAFNIGRAALQDLDIGGYPIRRGEYALMPVYTLHRRPESFPDPDRFDPDRFSAERERALPRYAYLPFGAGPRICIGNHFALMEGHLLLAALAQRVTFAMVPGQTVEPQVRVVLRPRQPIQMVVRRR